eukprot:9484963-Pyramimonas_sp.AAC.1
MVESWFRVLAFSSFRRPKAAQAASNMAAQRPQRGLEIARDARNTAARQPESAPGEPRADPRLQRRTHGRPQTTPRWPLTAAPDDHEGTERAPRWPKTAPTDLQDGSSGAQETHHMRSTWLLQG